LRLTKIYMIDLKWFIWR